ncbi:MAG: hypothetical protein AAGL98_14555 [Planctomycetota bacterium]
MLRYGDADLPDDGSTPAVTWAGAEHVDRVVLVATPSGGSIDALVQLVSGTKFSPIHSRYEAATLGTMPSIYQLLPRDRHGRTQPVAAFHEPGAAGVEPLALFDLQTWKKHGWGLADTRPRAVRQLARLMPDTPEDRRPAAALDHLEKCLDRARRFHAALDQAAALPDKISLSLYAGDGVPTHDVAYVNDRGRIVRFARTPGDGTVTRESALMDERVGGVWSPHLVSPIDWTDVNFLFTDHIGLTADPVFADNVLHLLLESPNRIDPADAADVIP